MLIGHKAQQKKLNMLYKSGNLPHALLFSGPEGVGKKRVAKDFLKTINCENEDSSFKDTLSFCKECTNCREIEKGIHFDITEISPEDGEIKLESIEYLIEKISHRAIKASFKGFIIDQAHLMNAQSQNALLKTLEEPPGRAVIIIVTEYPSSLLPTILSRSFEIKFSLVLNKEIEKSIKDKEVVKLSLGRPGRALDYMNFPERKERAKKVESDVQEMLKKEISFSFSKIKEITDEKREEEFLNCALQIIEKEILEKIKKKESVFQCCEVAKELERVFFLKSKTNASNRLMLEKAMTKFLS